MRGFSAGIGIAAFLAALLAPLNAQNQLPLKAAFIYIGPAGDLGWTYEHESGRRKAANFLGAKARLDYVENVPEGPDAEEVIRRFAIDGYDMIFATSYGHGEAMRAVAAEYPSVKFEHCAGEKRAANLSTYFGRIEEARYLSGMIAGSMTRSGAIGFVAAFPIAEVVRGINAFALGIRSVNPGATVRVAWTGSWYDPDAERRAAEALLDGGADIIAQHTDSIEPQLAARERGKLSIGYDSDMSSFVGDTVLASPVWRWEVYYREAISRAIDGTWTSRAYRGGLKEGIVALSPISGRVPSQVSAAVERAERDIEAGRLSVFAGPIRDRDGRLRVPADSELSESQELSMDWFVQGVEGGLK